MKYLTISFGRIPLGVGCVLAALAGCASFEPAPQSKVELEERPRVAILPFGIDVTITKLSSVKTVGGDLSPQEESQQVADAVAEIQAEARWLLLSRLATGRGFRVVPSEETDALAEELHLHPGAVPTPEQVTEFRRRLGADLVVAGSILDYGKVRWPWLAAGMFTDITAESIALGLATAWNPIAIGANVGFELLTSTPVWFGGGYLFGVAFRPVRVEARAFETTQGYPIWQTMEESVYAWGALKELPEAVRDKKEIQLELNLAETIETMADALLTQELRVSQLRGQPGVAKK